MIGEMISVSDETRAAARGWLRKAMGLRVSEAPFAWQEALLEKFLEGAIERALDIPTGLGKTAVMAIWLVARACGAPLPRRLVYVVDRRAVVDQATEAAVRLRDVVAQNDDLRAALGLPSARALPISTLRGQHVDNREWLEDPASVAIIVGTVDMVGSRLLFEGYGVSRKMRPYHAGLLGADTLLVLDEAHLVPPFEKLIETVAEGGQWFGPQEESLRALIPSFELMSLSATGRAGQHAPFGLTEADLRSGTVTRKRLDAPKRLRCVELGSGQKLEDALAACAWDLSGSGSDPVRCILFAHERRIAEASQKALERLGKKADMAIEFLVGGRRVREREEAAQRLAELGFVASNHVARQRPAFLIATSAGEVGVDLDADHMVCDLVAWERMVQRLGRVNRRGKGDATVVVLREPHPVPSSKADKKAVETRAEERNEKQAKVAARFNERVKRWSALKELFEHLPLLADGTRDASPGALRRLKLDGDQRVLEALGTATTPPLLRPALTRPLVDSWSLTSLNKHTGRPEVAPWLRGWTDDRPQTALVWRTHLPRRKDAAPLDKEIEAFFEAAPPHTSEVLETETYRVRDWLGARAMEVLKADRSSEVAPREPQVDADAGSPSQDNAPLRGCDMAVVVLDGSGDLKKVLRLNELVSHADDAKARKTHEQDLKRTLAHATAIVDARLAGLTKGGLLDAQHDDLPRTADDGATWMPVGDESGKDSSGSRAPVIRFRIRQLDSTRPATKHAQWRERYRLAATVSENDEITRWLVVDKWRHDAATEEDRSAGRPQLLAEHHQWTEERASALADRLRLPPPYAAALRIAARLHDGGKRARRWQRAFNASQDGVYAKTLKPLSYALLDGYRHEFGSLPHAMKDPQLLQLPENLQDLILHLVAAHHGFARPVISTSGCDDAPPSALEERARDVALRFARLQKRWGPWGLAWWEALLRAADQQASRDNDAVGAVTPAEECNG